jgi:hypothetical protein
MAPRAYRTEEELRRVPSREVPLDERVGEIPLGAGNRDAIALEREGVGSGRAKGLPLGRERAELLGEGLDCVRRATTPKPKGPHWGHGDSVHRFAEEKVKTGRKFCKPFVVLPRNPVG